MSNKQKTFLEKYLEKHEVSFYALTQQMGKDPRSSARDIALKVRGEYSISIDEFGKMLKAVETLTGKDLSQEEINYVIEKIKLI